MTTLPAARLIGDHLRRHAAARPDAPALIWGEIRLSYGDYADAVARARAVLHHAGIGKGDRVAVLAPPRPEVMILFVAITDIGAIYMGLNPRGTQAEHEVLLDDAAPKLLVSAVRHLDTDFRPELRALSGRFATILTLDEAVHGLGVDFATASAQADPAAQPPVAGTEDAAVLVYTSGSTGKPKGALVSHRSLLAGMGEQARPFADVDPVRMMFHVPIHHLGSVGNAGTTALILGAVLVFMDNFSPRAGLALVEREKITVWAQVPTMFLMQMALPEWETTDFSSVRKIFFAGSAMPAEGVQRLARVGAAMLTGYGLTETSGPVTLSLPDVPLADLSATIGSPCPGVELRIGDGDGNALPDGVEGEIMVRGDCIFPGYFHNEAATRAAIDGEGWFRTGDLAIIEAGRIMISGRKQEAFKSGGVNIYPREIEEVLQQHPSIAIACVVSVPDDIYQEVGVAYLVARDGQRIDRDEVRRYCAERLTKYKIPRRFEIRDQLPVIGIGKVDKVKLRAEARAAS